MVREGVGAKLYDLGIQEQFQSRVASVHAFFLRPPFETLIFLPFTYVGYAGAYALWTAASLAILVVVAALIESHTKIGMALTQYTRVRADLGLILVVFLTFAPTTTCLSIGQDSIFILLVYTLVFVLLRRGAEFQAGCVLALGLFKFHLIVPFVVVLLIRKKWPAIRGFAMIASLLVLASIAVAGPGILVEYPRVLFFNRPHWQQMGFQPRFTPNIRGFLYLLFGEKLPALVYGALIGIFSAWAVWWSARNWRQDHFELSFSASVVATFLVSFHLYTYDLTVLLLPVSIVCSELVQRGRLFAESTTLNAVLIVLFFPPVHFFLLTQEIYAVMFLPIIVLFVVIVRLANAESSLREDGGPQPSVGPN